MHRFKKDLPPPPRPALEAVRRLHAHGHEAWLVGGCVRDRLLERPVNDWDVATDATPTQVTAAFDKVIPTGIQHGTVTAILDGEPMEITTYRVEIGYTDGRRPDEVRFTRRLEDDLGRRDFTINAMAWDPEAGVVADYFDGRGDLERRLIRAVGTARERFDEDGLRAMRAVRFAAVLGFELEPETKVAITATLDTFDKIAVERVRVELVKALMSDRPGFGVRLFAETGLLARFLPEVNRQKLDEICTRLDRSPKRLAVRLVILLDGAEVVRATKRLRFSLAEQRNAAHLSRFVDIDPRVMAALADLRALVADVGPDAWPDLVAWGRTDLLDRDVWEALDALARNHDVLAGPHQVRDLPINGRDVMQALGIAPGPALKGILQELLERVWADPAMNDREALLRYLAERGT